MFRVNLLSAVLAICALPAWAADLSLVMVEQRGCHYCARWNAEIAPIWPKTAEGTRAPLRRIDLHAPLPADLQLTGKLIFTPTFIITADGTEVARLEGYPGEDFFWPMVRQLIETAQKDTEE